MKQSYPQESMGKLCDLFGKTRHAWYDNQWRQHDDFLKQEIIIQLVLQIRTKLPRVGTRKLLHMLQPQLAQHKLTAGRDYLFEVLAAHRLLIRTRKRKAITTNSRHWMHKYQNLVSELIIERPEQLWVSDITYLRLPKGFVYLSLITDAYSRKIVGYHLHKSLLAAGPVLALKMALSNRIDKHSSLIHHSDRGSQYCCTDYIELLCENNIGISMTQNGDPYENALAERVNGIIKNEFDLHSSRFAFQGTTQLLEESISSYNELRPHSSCDYLTPQEAHYRTGLLKKRWKNYKKAPVLTH